MGWELVEVNGFQMLMIGLGQYYAINIAYYFYHWVLHQPWSGPLYRAHFIGHHKVGFFFENFFQSIKFFKTLTE